MRNSNFFVNILRSANPGNGEIIKGEWDAVQDLSKRAEVVEEVINEDFVISRNVARSGAYLVSSLS